MILSIVTKYMCICQMYLMKIQKKIWRRQTENIYKIKFLKNIR